MVKKLLFVNSYGTIASTRYILWASRKQQEVSNHIIREISLNPGELVIMSRESSAEGWQVCTIAKILETM